ncbi:restriction endonuclease subunit S [Salinimicrobium sp. MT39]|uniref:Restriction endonuclease subunit S n=1 Tax=Salinimicrobium profundisediminis TaxID=2994553 RepID=A0A9X3CXF1_9FLAO|nr:restriction endonuclease subunit S [Salinimicrobium profundisediminis]MCX2837264.1 restriction endonuclease subunit S [Salinimicrobium profundisediminis]
MKSSYKTLGEYIRQVKVRNSDLSITEPMGINISKFFMPSVANTKGTDLSKYRVVKNGQFAYNPMHVGRDEVLPIALLKGKTKIIVSPAYVVFEIIDKKALLSEYLMMWFRRKDFDRNAWFTTDNSVRGGFSWESLCELKLPIPSPSIQQEIVDEYNTVVNRIKLNEELNTKLEETAQTLYNYWFVDFEFPISREYAQSIGKPELEGKPYKSSGGEMVFSEELDKEIPSKWEAEEFLQLFKLSGGGTPSTKNENYWNGEIPFFTPKDVGNYTYSFKTLKNISELGFRKSSTRIYPKNTTFITARGTVGAISIAGCKMAMNQSCYAVTGNYPFFTHQTSIDCVNQIKKEVVGAVFNALVTKDFNGKFEVKPSEEVLDKFENIARPLYAWMLSIALENAKNELLKDLLLAQISSLTLEIQEQTLTP